MKFGLKISVLFLISFLAGCGFKETQDKIPELQELFQNRITVGMAADDVIKILKSDELPVPVYRGIPTPLTVHYYVKLIQSEAQVQECRDSKEAYLNCLSNKKDLIECQKISKQSMSCELSPYSDAEFLGLIDKVKKGQINPREFEASIFIFLPHNSFSLTGRININRIIIDIDRSGKVGAIRGELYDDCPM